MITNLGIVNINGETSTWDSKYWSVIKKLKFKKNCFKTKPQKELLNKEELWFELYFCSLTNVLEQKYFTVNIFTVFNIEDIPF